MKITVIKSDLRQNKRLRACAYCRVSTVHEEQENSLENQISHYEEEITRDPRYEFIKVYYDFGISGFKESRPGFQQMIADARAGDFDLIITKSLTRFARNTVTVLKAIRELKEYGVGIFFELQNINTLTESGELMITILSAFAQGESESASIGAKMVYKRKYEAGIPVQYLDRSFGFMKDENGHFIPDPNEAKWVVIIYELAAAGYNLSEIARYMNGLDVKTKTGSAFNEGTVSRLLESEIYKGDYIMHKHYVNADRKLVPNKGQVDAWYIEDDHIPIVSRKLWDKAQLARQKRKDYLAEGSVVAELTDDNYPYMNNLFCAECGHPLYRRIYSNGRRVSWGCSGKRRYFSRFCKGINVPDSVIRSWGELPGNIYIREEKDELGKKKFKYVMESTWKKDHRGKKKHTPLPELNEENYPYLGKVFCAKCGYQLTRQMSGNNIVWICSGNKHKGKAFCSGIRIMDDELRKQHITEKTYIERKDGKNGEKRYYYSSASSTAAKREEHGIS